MSMPDVVHFSKVVREEIDFGRCAAIVNRVPTGLPFVNAVDSLLADSEYWKLSAHEKAVVALLVIQKLVQ